jgi:SSS family solute:Na+ symporter
MGSLTLLDACIFVGYMAIIFLLGVYASKKGKATKRDYFLAGDKLPWYMIGGSIVASNISSHSIVGIMGVAYNRGFVAMVMDWGSILVGFNALLWIFLPFYIRNGFYTVPEYLNKRFGTSVRLLYVVLILLTYVFVEIGSVLYLGAFSLSSLLDVPVMACVFILSLATGIYTITGGLRAVVWTEMLQLIILLLGCIILSYATFNATGGFEGIMSTSQGWDMLLPADDPDFPWTMYLGGTICTSIFYCATNQFIVQRALAAKNEWHAKMGVVFTNYLKFLIPLIITLPAMMAAKLIPGLDKPDMIFPTLVTRLLPVGLIGLVMAGLIAAVMSHLSGAINSSTTILTMDVYTAYFKKNATEREAVRFGKMAGVVIIVMGIICSSLLLNHSDKPIFLYLLSAYGFFTPGIATMFLMGIFWKRTTNAGAFAAGIITIPLSLVMEFCLPEMPFQNRTGIVFWICMVLCLVVSLFTKPRPVAEIDKLIWNKESLSPLPAEREHQRGLRNPFIWWAIVTAVVLSFYIRYG